MPVLAHTLRRGKAPGHRFVHHCLISRSAFSVASCWRFSTPACCFFMLACFASSTLRCLSISPPARPFRRGRCAVATDKRGLAHGPDHREMEQEQPLRDRRKPAQPQVTAAHVGQFVRQRHRRFPARHRVVGGEQDDRTVRPDDLGRDDIRRQTQLRAMAQSKPPCAPCAERLHRDVFQRRGASEQFAGVRPLSHGLLYQGEQAGHPQHGQPQVPVCPEPRRWCGGPARAARRSRW